MTREELVVHILLETQMYNIHYSELLPYYSEICEVNSPNYRGHYGTLGWCQREDILHSVALTTELEGGRYA